MDCYGVRGKPKGSSKAVIQFLISAGHLSQILLFRNVRIQPTDFVVDAAFQVSHGGPTLLLLYLRVVVQDLVPQPGQVVDTELVLFTCC